MTLLQIIIDAQKKKLTTEDDDPVPLELNKPGNVVEFVN